MTASSKNISQKRRLILRSNQSPGDILMLTAAVRDLHAAYPEMFVTDVRTSAEDIWANNPFLTPLREDEQDVEIVDMHYPLVHNCNQHPYHFVEAFPRFLEEKLGLPIPVTDFRGDIHLSQQERESLFPTVSTRFFRQLLDCDRRR